MLLIYLSIQYNAPRYKSFKASAVKFFWVLIDNKYVVHPAAHDLNEFDKASALTKGKKNLLVEFDKDLKLASTRQI